MSFKTEYEETRGIIRKAISWLREIQNDDGGWPGNKPHQRSWIWTTSGVILALLQCDEQIDESVLNGIKFLIDSENQNSDGDGQHQLGMIEALLKHQLGRFGHFRNSQRNMRKFVESESGYPLHKNQKEAGKNG